MRIGFIGQGWIGKNYAENFYERGYDVVRYAKEHPFTDGADSIAECDFVFIAVPTPSTPDGFDDSILRNVIDHIGEGKTAIIKSTIVPGTTERLQEQFPDKIIVHSPEFLTEKTAKYDASNPNRNIIGYVDERGEKKAHEIMDILPEAPYKAIIPARTAELIKYAGNCWFFFKVMYINMLYDMSRELGINYEDVKKAMSFDPRIGFSHLDAVHQGGRGAGGHCFIKDFSAFSNMYNELFEGTDLAGCSILRTMEKKNIELLKQTGKNMDLLRGVYGERV